MAQQTAPSRREPQQRTPAVLQLSRGLQRTYSQCARTAEPPSAAQLQPRPASVGASAAKKTTGQRHSNTNDAKRSAGAKDTSPSARRILTKKTRPSGNGGLDNEEQNLIVRVRDVLGGRASLPMQPEFVVLDLLGQGTFGQVFRCQNVETKEMVAIKVIRNHPSYYKQAIVEVQITRLLNASYREDEAPHFVRLKDTFEFRSHLCIVVELLSINLYELIAENNFNGFPLDVTRGFLQQINHALIQMEEIGVIHCDLKPENILLVGQDRFLSDVVYYNDPLMTRMVAHSDDAASGGGGAATLPTAKSASSRLTTGQTPYIKVVDFGSACMENETVYSYIQSRFYRSPEVLLGLPYTGSIDLWSLGCIAVEMFLGLPLFPGVSEHDQLRLIEETLGKLPQELLRQGRNVLKFYNVGANNRFVLKTPEEFARDTSADVQVSKKYFKYSKLEDMVHAYPHAKHASEPQRCHERERREAFLHFVRGLLRVDPAKRWSARDAMHHPFLTGAQFVREEVEFAQSMLAQSAASRVSPGPSQLPVVPLPTMPSVVAPPQRQRHYRSAHEPSMGSWSSPSRVADCLLPASPGYSESIWGPSGMPPYAPGRLHHGEQLSPSSAYYKHEHEHQHHQHQHQYLEKIHDKVAPSSHGDVASNRVYPFDPYGGRGGGDPRHAAYVRAHEMAATYSPPSSAYGSYGAPPPPHCKVTPTLSISSSESFPVVPVSPYEAVQQHEYDSPYYVHAPPPPPQMVGGHEWPWADPTSYELGHSTSLSCGERVAWGQEVPGMWRRDGVPRHHQYMPESASQPPPRRGKRQHTASWDSGDTRELRRHEPAHPHEPHHGGYGHVQHPQQQPQQHQHHRHSANGGGGNHRPHTTLRKGESKGKGAAARHRKSPKSAAKTLNTQQQLASQHRQHHHAQRDRENADAYYAQQSYHPAASKRDESAGVCSVEEKFSSAMSLDLAAAAMPLPT